MSRIASACRISKPMIKIGGWFDTTVRELYEMLYQNDSEYLFDSAILPNNFYAASCV
jgi:hypothetical protein